VVTIKVNWIFIARSWINYVIRCIITTLSKLLFSTTLEYTMTTCQQRPSVLNLFRPFIAQHFSLSNYFFVPSTNNIYQLWPKSGSGQFVFSTRAVLKKFSVLLATFYISGSDWLCNFIFPGYGNDSSDLSFANGRRGCILDDGCNSRRFAAIKLLLSKSHWSSGWSGTRNKLRPCVRRNFPNFSFSRVLEKFGNFSEKTGISKLRKFSRKSSEI